MPSCPMPENPSDVGFRSLISVSSSPHMVVFVDMSPVATTTPTLAFSWIWPSSPSTMAPTTLSPSLTRYTAS